MHICYVCSEYPPAPHGGIGSFTQTLGRAFVRKGHRVTVVGVYPQNVEETLEDEGVRVVRVPHGGIPRLRFLANRMRLTEAIRTIHTAHPIGVVEGGELDLGLAGRSSPGIKILRMHGGPHFFATGPRPGLVAGLAERWSFRVADHLCAVSQCVAEETRRLLKLGDRPITVIPNPVDIELFAPSPEAAEEEGLIVFAGTVTERKGITQLVQAMPRIVAEVPAAHLEVYGGEAIGSSADAMTRALAASVPPEVAAKIRWMGRVPRSQLPRALQRASVCTYPSHMEAMPIAWLEGMASGKAVVASRTGPGPELIDDGITGLLCDPHDPDSIAQSIIRVLKDHDLRCRLGAAARRVVQQRYSLEPLVERNLAYYREILAGPARV